MLQSFWPVLDDEEEILWLHTYMFFHLQPVK